MYDVLVIGAGPAGNYVARRCAEQGFSVAVLEEHSQVGIPVHCTGIVGEEIFTRFDIKRDAVIKTVPSFVVFSPKGDSFTFPDSIRACVLDRGRFDFLMARQAEDAGAEYLLDTKATAVVQHDDRVTITAEAAGREITLEAKIGILATGAMSNLPFDCGISKAQYFYKSVQTLMEVKDLAGAEMYLGNTVAPGSFAYAVSTNGKIAKTGLISRTRAKAYFDNLLESRFLKGRIGAMLEPIKYRRIPVGIPKHSVVGRLAAVGDAAGQLKTTTAGGIYYSIICASILADCIGEALGPKGEFHQRKLQRYDKRWKGEIGLELQAGMLVRSFFEKVEDDYLNRLVDLVKTPPVRKILEERGDFDKHRDFIIELIKVKEVRKLAFELARSNLYQQKFFTTVFDYLDRLTGRVPAGAEEEE